MNFRLLLNIFCLSVVLQACIDPFKPDFASTGKQRLLVVDGLITNENKPHSIILSMSIPIEEAKTGIVYEPVTDAILQIIDNQNNKYALTESTSGTYVTNPERFQAKVGDSYQLIIQLNEGEIYQSDFQQIKEVSPILDVTIRQEIEPVFRGGLLLGTEVVNLYTNVDSETEPIYTRYAYDGTYAAISDYQGSSICWPVSSSVPEDLSSFLVCYRSENKNLPLNIVSSEEQVNSNAQKIISEVVNRKFSIGYSMLLKKYSLTNTHYEFLDKVREQQKIGGSLFDPPPTEVRGNISNMDDPNSKALGFFAVSAVTRKRVFIDNIVIENVSIEPECVYDLNFYPDSKPDEFCCDCRLFPGATDQMPEFWGE